MSVRVAPSLFGGPGYGGILPAETHAPDVKPPKAHACRPRNVRVFADGMRQLKTRERNTLAFGFITGNLCPCPPFCQLMGGQTDTRTKKKEINGNCQDLVYQRNSGGFSESGWRLWLRLLVSVLCPRTSMHCANRALCA